MFPSLEVVKHDIHNHVTDILLDDDCFCSLHKTEQKSVHCSIHLRLLLCDDSWSTVFSHRFVVDDSFYGVLSGMVSLLVFVSDGVFVDLFHDLTSHCDLLDDCWTAGTALLSTWS